MITLTESQWQWVDEHRHSDATELLLHRPADIPAEAVEQIAARQSAATKLRHTLKRCPRLWFPSALLAQQCTSDAVARYHSSLLGEDERHVLDMTAGLGIDAMHIMCGGKRVCMCEISECAAEALRHNTSLMGIDDAEVVCADSSEWIKSVASDGFDVIFIDPARRDSTHGRRLRSLTECSPNVVELLGEMLRVAPRVLVKASPMLEISELARSLRHIHSVTAVGHKRSCSELLIDLRRSADSDAMTVGAVTLDDEGRTSASVYFACDDVSTDSYRSPAPGLVWYEPYAPVMKAGRFGQLSSRYGICQLSRHGHVYICEPQDAPASFPGLKYTITEVVKASKAEMRRLGKLYAPTGADVAVRHYPMTAEELRRAMGITRSSATRIIGCRDAQDRKWLVVVECRE